MNTIQKDAFEKLGQELRRGTIILVVLSQLSEPHYGYALIKTLAEKGYPVSQDTLYPLLRRLEEQHLLESEWRVEDPRPRKYYTINENGSVVYQALKNEWNQQTDIIRRITNEN